jgi:Holliday junction resolvase RusA-like endonuclease
LYAVSKQKQIQGQLRLVINAYFSIPASTSKKKRALMLAGKIRPVKRPDWDNVGKIVSDSLNKMAYHDDSCVVSAYIDKWYSEEPRLEFKLIKLGD